MTTTKLFMNGRSQAVRLPKECRFEEDEVEIKKIGDMVILVPKDKVLEIFQKSFDKFPKDFRIKREKDYPKERESLN